MRRNGSDWVTGQSKKEKKERSHDNFFKKEIGLMNEMNILKPVGKRGPMRIHRARSSDIMWTAFGTKIAIFLENNNKKLKHIDHLYHFCVLQKLTKLNLLMTYLFPVWQVPLDKWGKGEVSKLRLDQQTKLCPTFISQTSNLYIYTLIGILHLTLFWYPDTSRSNGCRT